MNNLIEQGFTANKRGDLTLIVGDVLTKWNSENLGFRSILVDEGNEVVSRSFSKFFNYSEKPDLYPDPLAYKDWELMEKLDGSTIIFSYIDGGLNIRTRGTISAVDFPTYSEIEDFVDVHQDFFMMAKRSLEGKSVIFEHYSPKNVIVINYGESPRFWLTAIIDNKTAELCSQETLDRIAQDFGFNRPQKYNLNSLEEISNALKDAENFEGYCLYYNAGQNIVKLKAPRYLFLHRAKSRLATYNKTVDVWDEIGRPGRDRFEDWIENNLDWEIVKNTQPFIDKLYDKVYKLENIYAKIKEQIHALEGLPRKEQALLIKQNFQQQHWSACFSALDNKLAIKAKYLYE